MCLLNFTQCRYIIIFSPRDDKVSPRLAQDQLHVRRLVAMSSETGPGIGRGRKSANGAGRRGDLGRRGSASAGALTRKPAAASDEVDLTDDDDLPLSVVHKKRIQQAKAADKRLGTAASSGDCVPKVSSDAVAAQEVARASPHSKRIKRFRFGVLTPRQGERDDVLQPGTETLDRFANSSQAVKDHYADPITNINFSSDDDVGFSVAACAPAGDLSAAIQALHSETVDEVTDNAEKHAEQSVIHVPDSQECVSMGLQDLFKAPALVSKSSKPSSSSTMVSSTQAASSHERDKARWKFKHLNPHDNSAESNVIQSMLERFSREDCVDIVDKFHFVLDAVGIVSFSGCCHVAELLTMSLEQFGCNPEVVRTLLSIESCTATGAFCEDIIYGDGVVEVRKGSPEYLATEVNIGQCCPIPHLAVAKSTHKNFVGMFDDTTPHDTKSIIQKLGGHAGYTMSFLDNVDAVDAPFFIWEVDVQCSPQFWKGMHRAQQRINSNGYATKCVEISAADMRVQTSCYIIGISLARFDLTKESALAILDKVFGTVAQMLDEVHRSDTCKASQHVFDPASFCYDNGCHRVLHVLKELLAKPKPKAGIPRSFFEALHAKGIAPSDCVPDKIFQRSTWFGIFSEKDKALISHDRMLHGLATGVSSVFATDLLSGPLDRMNPIDKAMCPSIKPACKIFVWDRLGLLVGDEMLRFATLPLGRFMTSDAISDRLYRMSEGGARQKLLPMLRMGMPLCFCFCAW